MATPVTIRGVGVCPAGLCEICFANGRYKPAEIIHHKIHLNTKNIYNPEITLGFNNLQRVCRDCHRDIHYPTGYKQKLKFDENGRVVGNAD